GADALESLDGPIQDLHVHPSFGVRDQRDGELIDTGVAGEPAAGELRQFVVEAGGETLPHRADVLAHHVEVVQEPLAGRPDVGSLRVAVAQPPMRVFQDTTRFLEPAKESGSATPLARWTDSLRGGDG